MTIALNCLVVGLAFSIIPGVSRKLSDNERITGQYIIRENGSFDIDSLYPSTGELGLANTFSIASDVARELLEIGEKEHAKLVKLQQQHWQQIYRLNRDSDECRALTEEFAREALSLLSKTQVEKWNSLNQRAAFFSLGPVAFLSKKSVSDEMGITKEQIDELKQNRAKQSSWLRSEINKLYSDALRKQIEPLSEVKQRRFMNLFGDVDDQNDVCTPSTMYWFADSELANKSKKPFEYDEDTCFVETIWRLDLSSELGFCGASGRTTGLGNLGRYFAYYRIRFAEDELADFIDSEFDYLATAYFENPDFFVRNKQDNSVPFIDFVSETFKKIRAAQRGRSFDRYVLANHLSNLGLIETLRNGLALGEDFVTGQELVELKKKNSEVAELLRTKSNEILDDFVAKQLRPLSSSQKRMLKNLLIPNSGKPENPMLMVPLELIYLGTALSDQNRSSYNTRNLKLAGYRLPDADLLKHGKLRPDNRPIRIDGK